MKKPLKKMWDKIRFWYWWHFQASEWDKVQHDAIFKGAAHMKNGKKIIGVNITLFP